MAYRAKHYKKTKKYKTPFFVYVVYLVICCSIVTATSFSKFYSTTDTLSKYTATGYAYDEATVMFSLDMTATSNGSASVNLAFDTNQESTSSQVVPFVVKNIGSVPFIYDVTISINTFPSYSANGPGMTITYNGSNFSPTTSSNSKIYSSIETVDAGEDSATQKITFALNRSVPYTNSNIKATIDIVARMT